MIVLSGNFVSNSYKSCRKTDLIETNISNLRLQSGVTLTIATITMLSPLETTLGGVQVSYKNNTL